MPSRFLRILLTTLCLTTTVCQAQTITFGSCVHQNKPQRIWNAVYAQRPDLFIFMGDNIYGDTPNMDVLAKKYRQQAEHPDFALLKQSCPYIGTWDDHDYGQNDAGAEWPHKEKSKQLMLDFLREPGNSPRRKRPGVYESYLYGSGKQRVQVILLDTRWFRGPLSRLPNDQAQARNKATGQGPYLPSASRAEILGAAQWQWLEEQLQQPAEVRLIVSSIPVIQEGTGWETWDNYPQEREKLYRLLTETQANGVILLSGDSHRAEFSRVDDKIPYPLWEVNSSGLTENAKSLPPNRNRIGQMYIEDNFGVIRFDWKREDPQITMEIRDADNDLVMQNTLRLSQLRNSR